MYPLLQGKLTRVFLTEKLFVSNHPYHCLVLIGRFQPFHNGHLDLVKKALDQSDYLIIVCGSANQSFSERNPWTWVEREAMIRSTLTANLNDRVIVVGVEDHTYNDNAWLIALRNTVSEAAQLTEAKLLDTSARWGLILNDSTPEPEYSHSLSVWPSVTIQTEPTPANFLGCGSAIRQQLFSATLAPQETLVLAKISASIPPQVSQWLTNNYINTQRYRNLVEEHQFIADYKKLWSRAPYPPNFVTVDALVEINGHILLIERGGMPGKGLLALPGGFLDPEEPIFDACLRELKEETCLNLSDRELRAAVVNQRYFDAPYRSARGRTITHVFHLNPELDKLPDVLGSDDAVLARWFDISELQSQLFFEDHYGILQIMLGI